MKVLKEGKLHKRMAWFVSCSCCGSEIRILDGDPMATKPVCYNCDASQYYARYICPVCRSKEVAMTDSSFKDNGNAEYKEIVLTVEDRKELLYFDSFDPEICLTEDEIKWISSRHRV